MESTVNPVPLRSAAYDHVQELSGLRNLALQTCRAYSGSYHRLAAYLEPKLGREPLTTDLTAQSLEDFFRDYVAKQSHSSWTTRKSMFTQIVPWLMKKGHLPWGPNFAQDLPQRKADTSRLRERRLSDTEFLKLLQAAAHSHIRDYYLCLFMRLGGRRVGEATSKQGEPNTGMKWGDVRWEENEIIWDNHKGRKGGKKMPLTPRVRAVLEAWRAAYCKELGVPDVRNDWYVFPALTATGPIRKGHKRRRALSPQFRITNSNRIITSLLEASGLWQQKGDGWHILRKTFGNQRQRVAAQQNRGDAWDLTRVALDHEKIETTRIYVDINEEYERYAQWAMETPELGEEAMAKIPELAALVPSPAPSLETTKTLASASVEDAQVPEEVYQADQSSAKVIPITFAGKRRALG